MHTHDKAMQNRLKRAQGHLGTIIRMIEDNRDGLEIVQQMKAVIGALEKAKTAIVADHIEHHLEEIVGPLPREARDKLASLGEIAKYL